MVDPYRLGRALYTNMHKVNEYIYIGNRRASEDIKTLTSERIVKILQLLDFYIPNEREYDIEIKFIQIEDSETQTLEYILPEALRFIHNAVLNRQKILIHCNAGVSRSGSILVAYLMASNKIDYKQALRMAKNSRPCIDPNPGFAKQLNSLDINYLQSLIN
ncbi:hypothetical protein SteCoe_8578 [Stentor coeruleus]|uniref:Protein-tyrosine-phosphatase n=1 Tax=Stentor coeruleus TaxID=5963 RepID=A0A1R2CJX1_9CILI|nr:hypothetical protein SteCoe_8578 [Stentor coeruleus]